LIGFGGVVDELSDPETFMDCTEAEALNASNGAGIQQLQSTYVPLSAAAPPELSEILDDIQGIINGGEDAGLQQVRVPDSRL